MGHMLSIHHDDVCEHLTESVGAPDDTPAEALPPGTTLTGRIDTYRGWGETPLRYRTVEALDARGCVVYLHGIESHGAWFLPAAARLRRHGYTTYLLDRRGSGLNHCTGPGDAPGADAWIEDVQRFRERRGDEPAHLVALSWGGKLALAAALQDPVAWRSVTLITPGLRAKVDLPLRHKWAVLLNMFHGGRRTVPVPIRPEMFTTTPRYLRFIQGDPWRLRRITARFCLASRALDRRIASRGARLQTPLLVVLAERDRIIDNAGVTRLVGRLRPDAAVAVLAGAEHAVQFDRTPRLVNEMVLQFGGVPAPETPP